MLHVNPNAIGSLVPLFAGGPSGGGAGPATQDHQSPSIIVGNAAAGDTIFVCDILDPGDGTGIQLAVNQAAADLGGRRHVFVRAGAYVLTAPIFVPNGVRLQGSGVFETLLENSPTSRSVIIHLGGGGDLPSEFSDFLVHVVPAAPGAVGSVVLEVSESVIHDVVVIFDDTVQAQIANDSLRACFSWATSSAVFWAQRLVVAGGLSFADAGLLGTFTAFHTAGGFPGVPHRFSACQSIATTDDQGNPLSRCDVGFYAESCTSFVDCCAFVPAVKGFSIAESALATFVSCGVAFATVPNGVSYGGFIFEGNSCEFPSMTGCYVIAFDPNILPPGGLGIAFVPGGFGNAPSVVNCVVLNFEIGIVIRANVDDARVGFCYVQAQGGAPIAIDDQSLSSELGHNITYP